MQAGPLTQNGAGWPFLQRAMAGAHHPACTVVDSGVGARAASLVSLPFACGKLSMAWREMPVPRSARGRENVCVVDCWLVLLRLASLLLLQARRSNWLRDYSPLSSARPLME